MLRLDRPSATSASRPFAIVPARKTLVVAGTPGLLIVTRPYDTFELLSDPTGYGKAHRRIDKGYHNTKAIASLAKKVVFMSIQHQRCLENYFFLSPIREGTFGPTVLPMVPASRNLLGINSYSINSFLPGFLASRV
jgi:hypothetical protein